MRVRDIASVIEAFAPLELQESWDNSGLCIGSPEQETKGVLVGFDCTETLIDEAVANGCDMVVTHHPLIFGGLKKISPEDPVGRTVLKAAAAGVAVYAAHTNADKVPGGVSGAMARRLGLQDVRILNEEAGGVGLGVVGNLPEPLSAADAVALVKDRFGLPAVRTSSLVKDPVRTVALCGGSGSSLIDAARRSGAQLYVCGDISYHHFFTPEGFMVMDIGHFEGEVEIAEILFSLLKKNFPTFAVRISDRLYGSNPVKYL